MKNKLVLNNSLEFLIKFQEIIIDNYKNTILDNRVGDDEVSMAMEDILRILEHLKDMGVTTVGLDNNVN